MTKKDGSLMANLINPETKKIVSTVSLGKVKLSPELSQAMTNYATQMQMAQIAEQIQFVQVAVEEVRQGQEYDRLATAYSCQQKLIQAAAIQNQMCIRDSYLDNPRKLFSVEEYHYENHKAILLLPVIFLPWILALAAMFLLNIPLPTR